MAHGTWPVPAPAVVKLIEGFPARFVGLEGETVTPTGAALIVTLADSVGTEARLRIERTAAGAGTREWPGRPNILRGFLGESEAGLNEDEVDVLETAIDDMTPEAAAHLASRLLECGALDVVTTPVLMKKGRSGFQLTVLAPAGAGPETADRIFRESTTLGLRIRRERRLILPREIIRVVTPWGDVAVKVASVPGGAVRFAPEYEECARLSREHNVPLLEVMEAARRAASSTSRANPNM